MTDSGMIGCRGNIRAEFVRTTGPRGPAWPAQRCALGVIAGLWDLGLNTGRLGEPLRSARGRV